MSYVPSKISTDKRQDLGMEIARALPLKSPTKLTLTFWGTRGSIPVSGSDYLRYGGNTSCVSLTSNAGHLFIFDCGSGARLLGNHLVSTQWQASNYEQTGSNNVIAYILLSHTHWDHIQGFPFFAPAFKPDNHFCFIAGTDEASPILNLNDIMGGQMQQCYFPVALDELPSLIKFGGIGKKGTLLDGAKLNVKLLKHPIPSTAYRLELADKVLVYATDHEPLNLPVFQPDSLLGEDVIDPNLLTLAANADVMIHDAQYSTSELKEKIGWGHNSAEVAVDTAIKAGVKKLILYHHDPSHSDAIIDQLLADAKKRSAELGIDENRLQIIAAGDGLSLEL